MTKEETIKEIQELIGSINEHQANMTKLQDSLRNAMRGDVTMSCLDDIRSVLSGMSTTRVNVEKAKKVVKARITARLKD
jgi:hypothetical protein